MTMKMKSIPRKQSTALCLCFVVGLIARTTILADEPISLTRGEAIETAIRNNLDLAVVGLDIDRAAARLHWAGRLSNPELHLAGTTDAWGLDEGEESFEIGVTQQFPLTSRLKKDRMVSQRQVDLARIEFRARQHELAYDVEKVWITLWAAERSEQFQRKLLDLNKEIVAFLTDRVQLGEVSPLDTVQASLNGNLLEQRLGISQAKVASTRSELQAVLGLAPGQSIQLAGDLTFPAEVPSSSLDLETVLGRRPDHAALLASRGLAQAQRELAETRRWDDVAVKVFVEQETSNDEPVGLEDNTLAGIGFSIPLPFRKQNGLDIEKAEIDQRKANRAIDAKRFEVGHSLAAAVATRKWAHRLAVAAGGEALSLAAKNLADLQAAQQSGLAGPLQVQQAQAQLLQLETSALELRQRFHLADAEVRFLSGTYPMFNEVHEASHFVSRPEVSP